jgi:hypothetical protein
LVFLSPFVSPFFFALVLYLFLAHVVSSLAHPNLLWNKRLGCCCCCCYQERATSPKTRGLSGSQAFGPDHWVLPDRTYPQISCTLCSNVPECHTPTFQVWSHRAPLLQHAWPVWSSLRTQTFFFCQEWSSSPYNRRLTRRNSKREPALGTSTSNNG